MSSAYSGSSGIREGHEARPGTSQSIADSRPAARGAAILAFRRYRVYPSARRITAGDQEIALGGRAFDLLVALLRARGKVVSQFEIVRQVWPSLTVDSCNLRFQMAVLRRALGTDRDVIKTVRGRGYLIVDDCDPASAWPMEAAHISDDGATDAQSGIVDTIPGGFREFAPLADSASFTRMVGSLSSTQPHGLAAQKGPDMAWSAAAPRSLAIGEIDPGDVKQRLAELEQENIWLKLTIANLTLKRMAQILPQDM